MVTGEDGHLGRPPEIIFQPAKHFAARRSPAIPPRKLRVKFLEPSTLAQVCKVVVLMWRGRKRAREMGRTIG
jgi:hypothetical protein